MTDFLSHMEYRLQDGVSDDALAAASAPIDDWAAAKPGFRYRCVARRADGTVVDLMYWADRPSQESADADFIASGCGAALLPLMVEDSFRAEGMRLVSARPGGAVSAADADAASASAAA